MNRKHRVINFVSLIAIIFSSFSPLLSLPVVNAVDLEETQTELIQENDPIPTDSGTSEPDAVTLTTVTPEIPTITTLECTDGSMFAQSVTPATTIGVVYRVGDISTDGSYTITATLDDVSTTTWSDNLDDWQLDGDVAIYHGSLELCPALPAPEQDDPAEDPAPEAPESTPVSPENPVIVTEACEDVAHEAPEVILAETTGISYSISAPDDDGNLTIIATLQDGFEWANDGIFQDWTIDPADPLIATFNTPVQPCPPAMSINDNGDNPITNAILIHNVVTPANGLVGPGEVIGFQVTLVNNGDDDGIATIKITLPPALTSAPLNVTTEGLCGEVLEGEVSCEDIAIAAGESVDIFYEVTLPTEYDEAFCGDHNNRAVLSGTAVSHTATFRLRCDEGLTISKTADKEEVKPGDAVTYKIEASNRTSGFRSIRFVDELPAGVTLDDWRLYRVSDSDPEEEFEVPPSGFNCEIQSGGVNGSLACSSGPGVNHGNKSTFVVEITVTVNEDHSCPGSLTNYVQGNWAHHTGSHVDSVTTNVVCPLADISLSKSLVSPESGAAQFGDTIEFQVTLTNDGRGDGTASFVDTLPEALADLPWSVTPDDLCGDVINGQITCEDVEVPADESVDITFEVTLPPEYDEVFCGWHTNSVVPSGPDNAQTASFEVWCASGLSITKAADKTEVEPGDTITYTIAVSNVSGAFLPVEFTDLLPEGVTYEGWLAYSFWHHDPSTVYPMEEDSYHCDSENGVVSCGALNTHTGIRSGATSIIEITVTVDQDHSCPATLVNSVQGLWANSENSSSDSVATQVGCPAPDLSIEKFAAVYAPGTSEPRAGTTASPGDTIEFTISVMNSGTAAAEGVAFEDQLDPGLTNLTWMVDNENCAITNGFLECENLIVDIGESISVTLTSSPITTTNPVCGDYQNTATLTSGGEGTSDPVSISIECVAVISIDKSAEVQPGDDGRVDAGDSIAYTFVVTNPGNQPLVDIEVVDVLPGLEWGTDPTAAALAPDETVTFSATYEISQDVLNAGKVENTAVVTASHEGDSAPTNNQVSDSATISDEDTVITTLQQEPGIALVKTGELSPDDDGLINYTIVITNTGNITLLNLDLAASLEGFTWDGENSVASLDPGQSATFTASYAVTASDIEEGTVLSCAEVTTGDIGPTAEDCVAIEIPAPDPGEATPEVKPVVPVVRELPSTGHGGFAATASMLWAAALLAVVAFGTRAIGIRRR